MDILIDIDNTPELITPECNKKKSMRECSSTNIQVQKAEASNMRPVMKYFYTFGLFFTGIVSETPISVCWKARLCSIWKVIKHIQWWSIFTCLPACLFCIWDSSLFFKFYFSALLDSILLPTLWTSYFLARLLKANRKMNQLLLSLYISWVNNLLHDVKYITSV